MADIYDEDLSARPRACAPLSPRLRRLGGSLLSLPGLRALRPTARRLLAVASPADRLTVAMVPAGPGFHGAAGLTVVSANLWHDWPRRRRLSERLEAFARLVEAEGADVVLLQEVARTPNLRVDEWLASRLGMARVYSRANGHEAAIGFEEGLAVLSRYPLARPRLRQLPPAYSAFVHRLALGAEIEAPQGRLLAFSVHLGLLRRQNAAQLDHLRRWVTETVGGGTALIGGDFNAREGSSQIARAQHAWIDTFRHLNPLADGTTHVLRWPWGGVLRRERLDYLFLHPGEGRWVVKASRHLEAPGEPHSDHRAVLVHLGPRADAGTPT